MQSPHATTLTRDRFIRDPPSKPEPPAARATRSRRGFRAFSLATAALVAAGGYVHFCLYRHGYRAIPKIGVAFELQVAASALVVLALIVGPHRLARVAHASDGLAGAMTELMAAALAVGTLFAFALTRTSGGL